MKFLLLLLLLANLALFAILQWGGDLSARQAAHPPINPERIRLAGEKPPVAKPVKPAPAQVAPIQAAAPARVCMKWGPIAPGRLDNALELLNELKLGERLVRHEQGSPGGPYWIYIPPQSSKAEADRKVEELVRLGVKDVAAVREAGAMQHAISLGLYAKEAIASARLAELRKKGVQNARIEARGKTASLFVLRDLDTSEQDKMEQIQQVFGGTRLQQVACQP